MILQVTGVRRGGLFELVSQFFFQDWSFTKHGQLKHDDICLAVKIGRVNEVVRFQPCLDKHPNQVKFRSYKSCLLKYSCKTICAYDFF
jgi:hypothetical protein